MSGNVANLAEANGVSIFFDPKVPPKVPTLTVSPRTGVVDHQLVTVSGRGFSPASSVSISQCVKHAPAGNPGGNSICGYSTTRYVKITAGGTFTTSNFALERRQALFSRAGTKLIDCGSAPGTCNVRAIGGTIGGSTPVSVLLSFDPKIPPVKPTVSASPRTALRDLDSITLTARGFAPGVAVRVQECVAATGALISTCDYATTRGVSAGSHGELQLTLAVRRNITGFISPSAAGPVDCATQRGKCRLRIQGSQSQPAQTIALEFNPNVPAVARRISADPNTNLSDNQEITVSLRGFTPNQTAQVIECSAEVVSENGDQSYCDYNSSQIATPTDANAARVPFHVRRTLGLQSGRVDCSSRAGACVLIATQGYSGGGYSGSGVPLATTATTSPTATTTPAALRVPTVAFAKLTFSTP